MQQEIHLQSTLPLKWMKNQKMNFIIMSRPIKMQT